MFSRNINTRKISLWWTVYDVVADPSFLSRVAFTSVVRPLWTDDRGLVSSMSLLSLPVSSGMAPSSFRADVSEISGTPRRFASPGMRRGLRSVTQGRSFLQRGQLSTLNRQEKQPKNLPHPLAQDIIKEEAVSRHIRHLKSSFRLFFSSSVFKNSRILSSFASVPLPLWVLWVTETKPVPSLAISDEGTGEETASSSTSSSSLW